MNDIKESNAEMVFDSTSELIIIFNPQEILYRNKSSERILGPQSRNWKELFSNASIRDQLDVFFESSKLPHMYYLQVPSQNGGKDLNTDWRFMGLSLEKGNKIWMAFGTV